MNAQFHFVLNAGLCWFIVFMAVGGYFLTLKRMGQKWPFWMILIAGWTLLAVSNSLIALGINWGTSYTFAIWLSSFVLVFASLVLLFIKIIQLMQARVNGITEEVNREKM